MAGHVQFSTRPRCSKAGTLPAIGRCGGLAHRWRGDAVANMANVAAAIAMFLPDLNWAGFYRVVGDELVLGPFIGRPACIRIPIGTGVCGTAARTGATQIVADVRAFPGHIACDPASLSELVVSVTSGGSIIAVIDCDSPTLSRFDESDAAGLEELAKRIADRIR